MPCIDPGAPALARLKRHARWAASLGLTLLLTACGNSSQRAATPSPGSSASAEPARPAAPRPGHAPDSDRAGTPSPAPAARRLPPPSPVTTREDLTLQAAKRLVEANPEATYMGEVPGVLLAIPVLEVELNRDGSVKHIRVLRRPGQAVDTIDLAIAAVHRAAPFGDVSAMPRPWKFNEVFLFNDQRRFKPRTLDD